MDRQDKGKKPIVITKKKKKTPPAYRRPTGIHICEPQPDSVPSRPSFSHSRSTQELHQELHPAPAHVGPQDDGIQTRVLPIPIPTPTLGYRSLGGDSTVPSTSATGSSSSHGGSVGLSDLHLRDTPETSTTGQSGAPVIQPGTRDNNRRTYIVPEGSGFRPNERISKIIFKCIARNFRGIWTYWSKIPSKEVAFMFTEFEKYFCWDDNDRDKIFINFTKRARVRFNGLLHDARRKHKKPRFVPPEIWKEMLYYWDNDLDFKKRSEKGKMARASVKGGSLHTAGAISQTTVRDRMEKELGRPITQDELFKVTHMKKKKKPTDEDTWVEPRAQQTYEKYMKEIENLQSQGVTPSQEQEVEIWKDCAGNPVRGNVYGLPGKSFQERESRLYYASTSSNIDSTVRASLEEKIAALSKELAEKEEREKKIVENYDRKFQQVQSQLDMLFQSGTIIPPCPSDRRRRRQPTPDDDYTTEEEEELGEEDEEVPPSMRRYQNRRL